MESTPTSAPRRTCGRHRDASAAGCGRIWVNGSFVTAKEEPADFDACWDSEGVDLDALDPVLLDLSAGRASQKSRFGGELFPNVGEAQSGLAFSEFFQNERDTGRKRSKCRLTACGNGGPTRRKSVAPRSGVPAASGVPCRRFPSLNCM